MQTRQLNETEWVGMAVLFLAEAVVAGKSLASEGEAFLSVTVTVNPVP